MEEQKGKVVDMAGKESEQPQKMSYEQLEQIAHQLSEQSRQLYGQLQKANLSNMFKRLDYLFKVIENSRMFSQSFISKCVDEIEGTITLPEDTKDEVEDSKE